MFEEKISFFSEREEVQEKYPIYPAKKRYHDLVEKFNLNTKINKTETHPKRCPGIMDIIFYGYIVPSWSDILIRVKDENILDVNFSDQRTSFELWQHEQIANVNKNSNWCPGFIKIASPWQVKTTKNTCAIYDRLPFKNETIFEAASGLLDTHVEHQTHIFLNITKKDGTYLIHAGTPLIQILPIKKSSFSMVIEKKGFEHPRKYFNDTFLGSLNRYNKSKFKFTFK